MKALYFSILITLLSACNNSPKHTNGTNPQSDSIAIHTEQSIEEEESETSTSDNACVSEDKRIAIQSGVHPESGTAPDYWAKWTIIDEKGTKHELTFDYSPYIDNIHSLQKADGSTYYIASCYGRASSSDGYEWLQAYKIVGDTIQEVNVMDGGQKIEENEFDINYYIPDWYHTTNGAGYEWIFEYDPATRNLYVPMTEERTITDRYQVWHFNGERFVRLGESPHKDMHESLATYNRLICHFTTKDYIVRVDSLDSHELRYASWKKPKTMADEPDIIIHGGARQEHPAADDELGRCDDYRFTNGSYEYLVNYCETKRLDNGYGEHHDHLLVKKNGKVIVKQEKESIE